MQRPLLFLLLSFLALRAFAQDPAPLPEASGLIAYGQASARARLLPDPRSGRAALVVEITPAGESRALSFRAPSAGCKGCSGARMEGRWTPSRVAFEKGFLAVEHMGGSGPDFWVWKTLWAWDPSLRSLRLRSAQRLGPGPDGALTLLSADWATGVRQESSTEGVLSSCRVSGPAPSFSDLSPEALAASAFAPACPEAPSASEHP